ncbi:SprT-like domain-containing protein [soil metagenome]
MNPVTGDQLRTALAKYIPAGAVDTCFDWIRTYRISVRIKHTRTSKYGDYHPPHEGKNHTITINHDLNAYAFLITFTHEVAHLTCFQKFKDRVAPHGEEWKAEFRYLLRPFLDQRIFPDDVAQAVTNYIKNPAASSCADLGMMKALRKYDTQTEGWTHLEEIPFNGTFKIKNGQHFIKGERLRKNYSCMDLHTRHKYFIHPLMEVQPVDV